MYDFLHPWTAVPELIGMHPDESNTCHPRLLFLLLLLNPSLVQCPIQRVGLQPDYPSKELCPGWKVVKVHLVGMADQGQVCYLDAQAYSQHLVTTDPHCLHLALKIQHPA
ncbi:hypothetical protein D3C74_403560 [compost metagenome]